MAGDKKITQLNELLAAKTTDVIPIVDLAGVDETKKITRDNLMGTPGPIGSNTPNSGTFTVLQLVSGTPVNNISNNTELGDGQTTLPTQYAVKTYVDNVISIINPRLVYEDSTAAVGDVLLVDTTNSDVVITLMDAEEGKFVVKKISDDTNKVIIYPEVGTIDQEAYTLIEDPNQSLTIVIYLDDFYII